mgnify:CR=1 FL=1
MNRRLHILLEGSVLLVHMMGWIGIYIILAFADHSRPHEEYISVLLLLFYGIAWLLRQKCHRLPLMLLGHGGLFLLIWIEASVTGRLDGADLFFTVIAAAGITLASVQLWKRSFPWLVYSMGWYVPTLCLVIYVSAFYMHDTTYKVVAALLTMVFLLLHLWCSYLQGIIEYLEQNRNLEDVPFGEIFRANTRVVTIILAVFACVVGIAMFVQMDQVFWWIGHTFGRIIAWIVHMIQMAVHWMEGLVRDVPVVTDAPVVTEAPLVNQQPVQGSENEWMYLLGGVGISLIFMFILFQRLIRYFDKPLKASVRPEYHKAPKTPDQIEEVVMDEEEDLPIFKNPRQKVRYLFKKRVQKKYQKKVPQTKTARELESEKKLVSYYDIARYSRREISRREWKELKKAIGGEPVER